MDKVQKGVIQTGAGAAAFTGGAVLGNEAGNRLDNEDVKALNDSFHHNGDFVPVHHAPATIFEGVTALFLEVGGVIASVLGVRNILKKEHRAEHHAAVAAPDVSAKAGNEGKPVGGKSVDKKALGEKAGGDIGFADPDNAMAWTVTAAPAAVAPDVVAVQKGIADAKQTAAPAKDSTPSRS